MKSITQPKTAAFFDVDGTLTRSNIVLPYVHFRTKTLSFWLKPFWVALFALKIPIYLALDKISRTLFNKFFYRCYKGMNAAEVRSWADEDFKELFLSRLYLEAVEIIRDYKRKGVMVVLVTGALDFIVQPLADFLQAEALIAAKMEEKGGRFTGKLMGKPVVDAYKLEAIRNFASRFGVDLSASFAYADSISDLKMLKCTGHPVAVNPDSKLFKEAEKSGWKVCRWKKHQLS